MKRFIVAMALALSLALPGLAAAEGTGMYLAPKFLMSIQSTGQMERSSGLAGSGVDNYNQFTVDGKRAAPGAAAAPAGRVRAMLAPRQDGTATPPAKPTTVTPAAPALRSSTRLEGAAP